MLLLGTGSYGFYWKPNEILLYKSNSKLIFLFTLKYVSKVTCYLVCVNAYRFYLRGHMIDVWAWSRPFLSLPLQCKHYRSTSWASKKNKKQWSIFSDRKVSHGPPHQIIDDTILIHNVFARWVPRELTAEWKHIPSIVYAIATTMRVMNGWGEY